MMVYVDTPCVVTRKVFRDKDNAARFIAANVTAFVKVIHQYGRVIVLYRAHVSQPSWSRNRNEAARRRPARRLPVQDWPEQYR